MGSSEQDLFGDLLDIFLSYSVILLNLGNEEIVETLC